MLNLLLVKYKGSSNANSPGPGGPGARARVRKTGFSDVSDYLGSVRDGARLPLGPVASGPSRMSNFLKSARERFGYRIGRAKARNAFIRN